MANVRVIIDGAEVAKLMRDQDQPVMTYLNTVVAHQLQERAKQLVGVSSSEDARMIGGSEAHLRDTIVKRFVVDSRGPSIWVGSELPYAIFHHEGTRPHVIEAKNAKFLRFRSRQSGEFVFRKRVNHPGTQPNRFLTDAARDIGLTVLESR